MASKSLLIGPYRLERTSNVVWHGDEPLPLGQRAVMVLRALAERRGEVVSKAAVMDAAWPNLVVGENNLAAQISAIRRILSCAAGGAEWIVTVPRRGYRFVGPVEHPAEDLEPIALPVDSTWQIHASVAFVGRERELARLQRELLRPGLVTITGAGGIGKTRLAVEALRVVGKRSKDGACFVALGDVIDASLVLPKIRQALGLPELANDPGVPRIAAELAAHDAILVLDNCEHLVAGVAELVRAILLSAPTVRILATSRTALDVEGEVVRALPALGVPSVGATREAIAQSDAVKLFVEFARRLEPDFALTESRSADVASVCRRLDGIPLALELAAARVPMLSVAEIDRLLEDRFRFLTREDRLVPKRQRTLRATSDWSYELLQSDERAALRAVSAFTGDFSLNAAAAVMPPELADTYSSLDVLSRLVRRSLVMADTSGREARYRLLETTRAYAREKLEEAGEGPSTRARHAAYFKAYYERCQVDRFSMADEVWDATYCNDLDNLRAALDWAFSDAGDAALGVALSGASYEAWISCEQRAEGYRRMELAVARIDAATDAAHRARLWFALALTPAAWMVTEQASLVALQRAVALLRQMDDPLLLGNALTYVVGMTLVHEQRIDEARAVLAEAGTLLASGAYPLALAAQLNILAMVQRIDRDLEAALASMNRSLSICHEVGARRSGIVQLANRADLKWEMGDKAGAEADAREAADIARQIGSSNALRLCLMNLACLLIDRGRAEEALPVLREALSNRQQRGLAWYWMDFLALRCALVGRLEDGARLLGYADARHAAHSVVRQGNETRARSQVEALLRRSMSDVALERLLAAGATLDEETACALVLAGDGRDVPPPPG